MKVGLRQSGIIESKIAGMGNEGEQEIGILVMKEIKAPEPEVPAKARRRKFSALPAADNAISHGQEQIFESSIICRYSFTTVLFRPVAKEINSGFSPSPLHKRTRLKSFMYLSTALIE